MKDQEERTAIPTTQKETLSTKNIWIRYQREMAVLKRQCWMKMMIKSDVCEYA